MRELFNYLQSTNEKKLLIQKFIFYQKKKIDFKARNPPGPKRSFNCNEFANWKVLLKTAKQSLYLRINLEKLSNIITNLKEPT